LYNNTASLVAHGRLLPSNGALLGLSSCHQIAPFSCHNRREQNPNEYRRGLLPGNGTTQIFRTNWKHTSLRRLL